ncbi:MAG: hypothetical protein ACTMIR_16205 [Cellulomonadaceae bacterium]
MRARVRDQGQVAIELIGVVVLLVIVAVVCVQGVAVAQIGSVAQEAARDGARALSQDRDYRSAVDAKLPDTAQVRDLRGETSASAAHVELTVSIPVGLGPWTFHDVTVTRQAEFPRS